MTNNIFLSAITGGFLSFFIISYLHYMPRSDIPKHLLHLPAQYVTNLISQEHFIELNQLMREMKEFPSNMDDLRTIGFTPKHEHIGEAIPINDDGSCSHPYLAPNINRTHCILPQRIDIGKHFITTGGNCLLLFTYLYHFCDTSCSMTEQKFIPIISHAS